MPKSPNVCLTYTLAYQPHSDSIFPGADQMLVCASWTVSLVCQANQVHVCSLLLLSSFIDFNEMPQDRPGSRQESQTYN